MPDTNVEELLDRIQAAARQAGVECLLENQNPAFHRHPSSTFMRDCVELSGSAPPASVAYGTEASNFPHIQDLVVLGPGDIAQAHKSDEWVELEQLELGTRVYGDLLRRHCL